MAAYKVEDRVVPTVVTAVMITSAISPAIIPYSIAVAPQVSMAKLFIIRDLATWE